MRYNVVNFALIATLKSLVGCQVTSNKSELEQHKNLLFRSYAKDVRGPEIITYPTTEKEVAQIVNFCIKNKLPIIPYGAGTSTSGQVSAEYGGVFLDFSKMQRIIEINTQEGYVVVEPGLSHNILNKRLKKYGFYFPVEAGKHATVGGMYATNAAGAGAVDSGSMKQNVMAARVITISHDIAEITELGQLTRKSSAGYNLLELFCGAEGTLGVTTQLTLRVRKIAGSTMTMVAQFDSIKDPINVVMNTRDYVRFKKIELLDQLQTECCVSFSKIYFLKKDRVTLLIELMGEENELMRNSEMVSSIIKINNGSMIDIKPSQYKSLWKMRKMAANAVIHTLGKNKNAIATDSCVPLSELALCINSSYKVMHSLNIKAPLIAHLGDGNFHFTLLFDPTNQEELGQIKNFQQQINGLARTFKGTCSGEHGIGTDKKLDLAKERPSAVEIMRIIKKTLDPYNLLNPGVLFSNITANPTPFSVRIPSKL
ncbi:MAG: FAD-binding protein [Legionellales bacterium]|nr:FAD-binding protein [Legionellales bacterium]